MAEVDLRRYVETLLPFDDDLFKSVLRDADEIVIAAVAGGSFTAVVRSPLAILESQADRLALSLAVSQSGYFEGNLPVWMVEAAIQGALGSPTAIEGIPPESLVGIYVMSLKEISGRLGDEDLSRFVDSAIDLASEALRAYRQANEATD